MLRVCGQVAHHRHVRHVGAGAGACGAQQRVLAGGEVGDAGSGGGREDAEVREVGVLRCVLTCLEVRVRACLLGL